MRRNARCNARRNVRRNTRNFVVLLVALPVLVACEPPPPPPPSPAPVPVTAETIVPGPFTPQIPLLGRVVAASRQSIRPPAAGRIAYPARFAGGLRTGETVRRGERLFTVEAPDVSLRLSEARLAAEASSSALGRARRGVEEGFLPQAELEQREIDDRLAAERLENAEWSAQRLVVASPADGILRVDAPLPPGAEVTPETVVAELAGQGAARVEAWAAAADLDRLETGHAALCRRAGGVDASEGRIVELDRHVDAGGVARVVIEVEDARDLPRPGEGVEVEVLLPEQSAAITVPEEAVRANGSLRSVFLLEERGAQLFAAARLVQVGGRAEGRVSILDGVSEGDRVAVDGVEYLADGARVRDVTPGAADDR